MVGPVLSDPARSVVAGIGMSGIGICGQVGFSPCLC